MRSLLVPARVATAVVTIAALALAAAPAQAANDPRPLTSSAHQRVTASGGRERGLLAALSGPREQRLRLAVSLAPHADADAVVTAAHGHGAAVRQRIAALHAVTFEVPAAAAAGLSRALTARGDVTSVLPVHARALDFVPDDTSYASQPYLGDVNAPAAWDVTHGSASVKVAVVDTGADAAHADLAGKIVSTHNAVTATSDVTDTIGHGTFVAGVVGAATNNATGVAGAGFDTSLMIEKVADANGDIFSDAEAAAIVHATDNGADVVNLSLGSAATDTLEQNAVQYAVSHGVVVVAAAGNSASNAQFYPAALPGVVAVGATDGGVRASFSNYGSWVDVGAPGVAIRSTTPTTATGGYAAAYDSGDGTSFASPLVAGEAALLIARSPAASAASIATAIATATTGSYGFAAGRVDFAGALADLPPTTAPAFTAPDDAATIAGDATVTATTSAPSVRFTLDGGPAVTAASDGGTATATIETYGLAGAHTLTAYDCNASGCNTTGTTRAVTVANGTPTITSPAPGGTVNTYTMTVTATTPDGAGRVRFYVDGGGPIGDDATAPFSVTTNTSQMNDGTYALTTVLCNRAGTVCDTTHPSPPVSFTVRSLHPAITAITPSAFSPNGDGRSDTATVTYTLDVPQHAAVAVRTVGGAILRGPGPLDSGTSTAGTHSWAWNGKRSDGSRVSDGTYWVEINTTKTVDGVVIRGQAKRSVRVDTVAPGLSSVSGNGATFYPPVDGFRDTFVPQVTTNEAGHLTLDVYTYGGTRVRSVDGGTKGAGRWGVAWNGRYASGTMVPAGTYKYAFSARDAAGNVRVLGRYTVSVSAKRLVAKTAQQTVVPDPSRYDAYVGVCSRGTTPALNHSTWTGSVGYYSDYYCYSDSTTLDGFVMNAHSFTLPSAVKYGSVRVGATGSEALSGYGDQAGLGYYDATGAVSDWGGNLGSAYGLHWAQSVTASAVLSGRTVKWFSGVTGGSYYQIRTFTVAWTYYVLA